MNAVSSNLSTPAMLIIIGIVAAIIVGAIVAIKTINKKKAERPLSLEDKIILLNNQLSNGTITKEDYDKQKAALLKNI